ncbi:MAG TPA: DHA2 family efflux MFS transporter permease subunit [Acidimicrobiales bacterium]|nr:DHA2 family efflux MFS transporter permease subunit [Acidimicrobiales bacterium]
MTDTGDDGGAPRAGTAEAARPWTLTWDRLLVEPRRPQMIRDRADAHWFAVAAVCVGAFMGQLDASIVTVALPTFQHTFDASVGAVTWVGLSYLLVLVATVTAVGRFADMWGRKLLYVYGFVIFTLASVLCGLAPDLGALCGFRALQAVGAAMLQANSLAIIVLVVPGRALGRAIGLQGAAQALGLAMGPTIGGLLLAAGGWRLIFFVNIPFGIFGALAAILLVPRSRNLLARVRFDWTGLGIFFPAVAALLCAITFGAAAGWGSAVIIGLFAAAAALGALFVWHERRDGDPMLDLGLFHSAHFSTGIVSGIGSYLVMFGVLLLVPFYLERGQGLGTARSGLELMAMPLAFGIVAPLAGRLADRVGARPLTVSGMGLVALGLTLLGLLAPSTTGFLVLLAAVGIGMGLFTSPNNASIMGAAPGQQAGMASGVLNMTRGVGTALGLALTGTVFVGAGGDGGTAAAQHAFAITAYVLAGVAVAAGVVSALRANGALADATLSSVE